MPNMTPEELRQQIRCIVGECEHGSDSTCPFNQGISDYYQSNKLLQLFTDLCGEVIDRDGLPLPDGVDAICARGLQAAQRHYVTKLTGKEMK